MPLEDDLDEVGLFLNLNKTVLLTNEAQPPNFFADTSAKTFCRSKQVYQGTNGWGVFSAWETTVAQN